MQLYSVVSNNAIFSKVTVSSWNKKKRVVISLFMKGAAISRMFHENLEVKKIIGFEKIETRTRIEGKNRAGNI